MTGANKANDVGQRHSGSEALMSSYDIVVITRSPLCEMSHLCYRFTAAVPQRHRVLAFAIYGYTIARVIVRKLIINSYADWNITAQKY